MHHTTEWTDTIEVGGVHYTVHIARRDVGYVVTSPDLEGLEVYAHSPVSVMSEARVGIVQVLAAEREADANG